MHKILVVDDEKIVRTTLIDILHDAGFSTTEASNGREAIEIAREESPDAVLLDLKMPGMNGIETLEELKKITPDLPVIIITGYGDIQSAIKAMKLGASDFILKPPDFDMLIVILQRVTEKSELQREIKRLNTEVETSLEYLLGKSQAIKKIIGQIQQVARSNFSLLIQGETGTGKSFVASVIHNLSERRNCPLISVDMGAIPETLVESELFGYEKGAFTGAEKKKKGFFEFASGGTIIIDELQNMSAYVQSKLLAIVEDRKIYPLGGTEPTRIDVRIIGITNADLKKNVEKKTFREDLFYRLCEVTISIPPLRERREDIPFFVQKFLRETCKELNKKVHDVSEGAQNLLNEYHWPGNVRELRNVIRRAVLFSQDNSITRENIECLLGIEERCDAIIYSSSFKELPLMSLNNVEKIMIKQALNFTNGNKTKAASILQIDYKTLLRKMKQYGI